MGEILPIVLVITGPTGVGKTVAAVMVAEELKGEIVSADSRQVYRGVAIGTAAPSPQLQKRVKHYLINERDPRQTWSAGAFASGAARCIREIIGRRRQPLVAGGSGFYIRALTEGLFEEPPVDPAERSRVRARLKTRLEKEGPEALHAELTRRDPRWAREVATTDSQRIVRGLEVYELHGVPLSDLQEEKKSGPPIEARWCVVILERDRQGLYDRLNARVERLIEAGWLDEARSLQSAKVPGDAPGLTGLGYDLLFEHLRGRISLYAAIEGIRQEHRNYAKRQLSWFRAMDAERISLKPEDGPEETAGMILDVWHKHLKPGRR